VYTSHIAVDQWFPKWAVRNSKGAVKQEWAVGGRKQTQLIIAFMLSY